MTDDPASIDQFVTYQVVQLANQFERHADQYLKEFPGMNGKKWRILVHIRKFQHKQPAEIATLMNLDFGYIVGLLSEMSYDGYLVSDNGPDGIEYSLTPAGIELYETLEPFMRNRQRNLIKGIETEQLEQFRHTLRQLQDNTRDYMGKKDT